MCSALYVTCIGSNTLTRRLAANLYEHSNHVTQSISLSNIYASPFKEKPSPEAVETCPAPLIREPREPASRLPTSFHRIAISKQRIRLGGADRDRTGDPLLAKQVLSQLSYSPTNGCFAKMVGLGRFELPTSPLSGVRSNQLSYRPVRPFPPPA
jgi:hypothetical protein